MKSKKTNTPEEDALEAWAASDDREIRPDAVIRKAEPEGRAAMRELLGEAAVTHFETWGNGGPPTREERWLNHPDDIAEARRRQELKQSGIFGWLKVALTRQRMPKRPSAPLPHHSINNTSGDEFVLNETQWNLIADHYGADRIT